jgi:hypothetical protein
MEQLDVQRIARVALRELGADVVDVTVTRDALPDRWRVSIGGNSPTTLIVRAGQGTTAQYVREQIIEQFQRR